jgi:hypothetical protein
MKPDKIVALKDGRRLEIYQDETYERDDTFEAQWPGKIYHWDPHYELGTRIGGPDDLEGDQHDVALPVYTYGDITGQVFDTRPLDRPFDSGQIGWIVATPAAVAACWPGGASRDEIRTRLRAQVHDFSLRWNNEVYGYRIMRYQLEAECEHCGRGAEWGEEDACWGFVGEIDQVLPWMLDQAGLKPDQVKED